MNTDALLSHRLIGLEDVGGLSHKNTNAKRIIKMSDNHMENIVSMTVKKI